MVARYGSHNLLDTLDTMDNTNVLEYGEDELFALAEKALGPGGPAVAEAARTSFTSTSTTWWTSTTNSSTT